MTIKKREKDKKKKKKEKEKVIMTLQRSLQRVTSVQILTHLTQETQHTATL